MRAPVPAGQLSRASRAGGRAGGALSPPPGPRRWLGEGAQPRPPARWLRLLAARCAAAGPGARRGRISFARRGRRCDSRLATSAPPPHLHPPKAGRSRAKPGPERRRRGTEGGAGWAARGAGGGCGCWCKERPQRRLSVCPVGGPNCSLSPSSFSLVRSGQTRIPGIYPTPRHDGNDAAAGTPVVCTVPFIYGHLVKPQALH